MKKVMFALCFMFGGVVTLVAQDTTSTQYRTETESQYPQQDAQMQPGQQDQDRERIQSTELPDEVKRSLEGAEYRGWLISGAFKGSGDQSMQSETNTDVTSPDNTNSDQTQPSPNATTGQDDEVYIVELKNGAETRTLIFDKDGQKLGEEMQNQNSQFDQNDPAQPETDPTEQPGQIEQPGQTDPEAGQTDPNATSDQTESTDFNQSTETRTDGSIESTDTESTIDEPQSTDTESTEPESTDQSTGTQSSQSTQTDQSRANEPK